MLSLPLCCATEFPSPIIVGDATVHLAHNISYATSIYASRPSVLPRFVSLTFSFALSVPTSRDLQFLVIPLSLFPIAPSFFSATSLLPSPVSRQPQRRQKRHRRHQRPQRPTPNDPQRAPTIPNDRQRRPTTVDSRCGRPRANQNLAPPPYTPRSIYTRCQLASLKSLRPSAASPSFPRNGLSRHRVQMPAPPPPPLPRAPPPKPAGAAARGRQLPQLRPSPLGRSSSSTCAGSHRR